MNTSQYKKIARTLKVVYAELEKEALKNGIPLTSDVYDKLLYNARLKVLENEGFTLEQYREAKAKVSGFSQADQLDAIEQSDSKVKEIGDRHIPTENEIEDIAEKVAKKYIVPPQIINKIVDRVTIKEPKIIKETIKVKEQYNAKPLEKKIDEVSKKVDDIKIPELPDLELFRQNITEDFNKEIQIKFQKEVPDFRKLGMGLDARITNLENNPVGTSVSFGATGEIPFTNSTTDDFDYSSLLKYDGTTFFLTGKNFGSSGNRVGDGFFTNLNVSSSGAFSTQSVGTKNISIQTSSVSFNDNSAGLSINLVGSSLTGGRTITLPDNGGTVALTSDLDAFVPYTGATTDVDLGDWALKASLIQIPGSGSLQLFNDGATGDTTSDIGTVAAEQGKFTFSTPGNLGILDFSNIDTTDKTFTFPNVSGTVGLVAGSDTQVIFNDGGSFGGDSRFLWLADPSFPTLKLGAEGANVYLNTPDATLTDGYGGAFQFGTGAGLGTGFGGDMFFSGGVGGETGGGANIGFEAGSGGATSGSGGSISLTAGNAQGGDSEGGNLTLIAGNAIGNAIGGAVQITGGNGDTGDQAGSITLESGTQTGFGSSALNLQAGGNDAGPANVFLGVNASTGANDGGSVQIEGASGGETSGAGGSISLTAGSAQGGDSDGGGIEISSGSATGSGSGGEISVSADNDNRISLSPASNGDSVMLKSASGGGDGFAIFNTSLLTSSSRTFTFPDTTGTLGLKNQEIATQGAGTAYSLTNTAAAIDFGTTDPVITLNVAGTYLIMGQIQLEYTGATVATETATIKVRRTNNTAADLSSVVVLDLPVSTVLTNTYGIFQIPPFIYATAATDDSVTIFGNVSAGLGAGTIDATAVGTKLTAIRLY